MTQINVSFQKWNPILAQPTLSNFKQRSFLMKDIVGALEDLPGINYKGLEEKELFQM